MRTDVLNACDQLLIGSINGIYQGIILTALVALGFRAMRRTNAATRHAVLFFTLILLVTLMIAHWKGMPSLSSGPLNTKSSVVAAFEPASDIANPLIAPTPDERLSRLLPGKASVYSDEEFLQEDPFEGAKENPGKLQKLVPERRLNHSTAKVLAPTFETGSEQSTSIRSRRVLVAESLDWLANHLVNPISVTFVIPPGLSLGLLGAWMAIAVGKLLVVIFHLHQIRSMKRSSAPPARELNSVFENLREKMDARRKVALRVSQVHKSPLLLGFVHPVILLPAAIGQEEKQAETEQVLRHELAHVRRHDDWVNLVQHLIHAFFFFHPAVWWISRRLCLEREIACDDQVLQQSGRRAYAFLLANLATRIQGNHPVLAPGTSSNKNQLKQRIDMVLDRSRNTSPQVAKARGGLMTLAAGLLAAAATCYAPRAVLAQNERQPPPRPETVRSPKDEPGPGIPLPGPAGADQPGRSPGPYANPPGPRQFRDEPFAAGGQPGPTPPRPRAPMTPGMGPGERPLEQRLARVERMLEMLISRSDLNPGEADFHAKGLAEKQAMMEQRQHFRDAERRFKEYGESEGHRDQGRQAEAAKALKQEMERMSQAGSKDRAKNQLHMLRKRLEMLEREKEKLGQEIERLQQEQESSEKRGKPEKSSDKQ